MRGVGKGNHPPLVKGEHFTLPLGDLTLTSDGTRASVSAVNNSGRSLFVL